MSDCLFCKISKKEISTYIIEETENFLVFLDINPHAPGHSLIISKNHYNNLLDLPESLGEELVKITKKVALILNKAFETDNFTIGINNGSFAGQAIMHFHLHLIPRFVNDGGGSIHSVVFNKPNESLEKIYQKIKNASQS